MLQDGSFMDYRRDVQYTAQRRPPIDAAACARCKQKQEGQAAVPDWMLSKGRRTICMIVVRLSAGSASICSCDIASTC
jgi:hypothetical protein